MARYRERQVAVTEFFKPGQAQISFTPSGNVAVRIEEEVVAKAAGRTDHSRGRWISVDVKKVDLGLAFAKRDPETDEIVGQYTYAEIEQLIYSLYRTKSE